MRDLERLDGLSEGVLTPVTDGVGEPGSLGTYD